MKFLYKVQIETHFVRQSQTQSYLLENARNRALISPCTYALMTVLITLLKEVLDKH